jgi:tetratricopeptide (TPR) repeat protein
MARHPSLAPWAIAAAMLIGAALSVVQARHAPPIAPIAERSPTASELANRGAARRRSGQLTEAIEDLRRALELDPQSVSAHTELAWVRFDQGQLPAAIRRFTKALAIDPVNASALAGRGAAKAARNDDYGALRDLARSIELDSQHSWVFAELARVQIRLQDDGGAQATLARALAFGHENAALMSLMAWTYMGSEDPLLVNRAIAFDYARRAVDLEPANGAYWNTLAVALSCTGDWQLSLDALERSFALVTDPDVYDWIVSMFRNWPPEDVPSALQYARDVAELVARKAPDEELREAVEEAAELAGLSGR